MSTLLDKKLIPQSGVLHLTDVRRLKAFPNEAG